MSQNNHSKELLDDSNHKFSMLEEQLLVKEKSIASLHAKIHSMEEEYESNIT